MGNQNIVVRAENLNKTYHQGENEIHAVWHSSFCVCEGELVAITGQSGSGKTTLLNILGCINKPDSGKLWIDDTEVIGAADEKRAKIRREKIGYIFQDYKLLPVLTVKENILLPLRLAKMKYNERELQSIAALLGIDTWMDSFPSQLSGGQQQRAAIARALIHHPKMILADEPTGNLDSRNAGEILKIFEELNARGTTVLMVTHNEMIAKMCQRKFVISDGCLSEI